jgi:hypothetical protein
MSSQPEPTPPGTFWSKLSARQKKLFAIFSAFGLLVSTAGAFSKTRNWILGFTDEKKIAAAIDKMESDTATQAWQKALSKLDGAADDSRPLPA